MKERFQSLLRQCPAIAILRGITPAEVPDVCDILADAGISLLEIPLNSPDAVRSIRIAAQMADGRFMTGAGTVLTPGQVAEVREAGGTFIISPNTDIAVIRETNRLGMISIPGFFTASEGLTALREGADFLKLFPAILGTGYIRDLRAVLSAPILAVGGVNDENISGFLQVCRGVGVGSALYKPGKSLAAIAADAKKIVAAVAKEQIVPL